MLVFGAEPGGFDWGVFWDASAAIATLVGAIVVYGMWRSDKRAQRKRQDHEAQLLGLVLLSALARIKEALGVLTDEIGPSGDTSWVADVFAEKDIGRRRDISAKARLLHSPALEKHTEGFGTLPVTVGCSLVETLAALEIVRSLAEPIGEWSQAQVDSDLYPTMEAIRLHATTAQVRLANAIRVLNVFLVDVLED